MTTKIECHDKECREMAVFEGKGTWCNPSAPCFQWEEISLCDFCDKETAFTSHDDNANGLRAYSGLQGVLYGVPGGAGMNKVYVRIGVMGNADPNHCRLVAIKAIPIREWCYHKKIIGASGMQTLSDEFNVTHIPSGMRAGKGVLSEAIARQYCMELASAGLPVWDMEKPYVPSEAFLKRVNAIKATYEDP